eukprot:CAMPEP_0170568200 /NCGR_PEP_ID=MMETSP0211-20121228/81008_1 /TAXON_ID=311385 /ORGANISM="Pseudokeronopsis sp., Strain OXSARD2" /LENGTH=61 /DNA_ID=CAMNT_0010889949 /DNA_START=522 /DNA_END=707 /DNA_ORIENTATION=-
MENCLSLPKINENDISLEGPKQFTTMVNPEQEAFLKKLFKKEEVLKPKMSNCRQEKKMYYK